MFRFSALHFVDGSQGIKKHRAGDTAIYIGVPNAVLKSNQQYIRIAQYSGAFGKISLSWKTSKYYTFSVCVCSFIYPACNAHAPYYIAFGGLAGSTIFFYTVTYTHGVRKTLWNIKYLFRFSLQI